MPVFPLKMSMQRNRVCAAIGCMLATLVFSAAPARAQEEDSVEQKMMDSIMGAVGLTRKAGEGIDYRERSPLVVPPGAALPPPQSDKVANPNWPVNPEVKEARAIAAMNAKGDGRTSSQKMDDSARPLPRSELEKGRTNRPQNNPQGNDSLLPSSWSELGYKGGIFGNMFKGEQDETARFTGEPPRTSLIAPPPGYQTPSPNQPYAHGKAAYRDKAVDPYADRKYER